MPNELVLECHLNTRQPSHLNTGQIDTILVSYVLVRYLNGQSSTKCGVISPGLPGIWSCKCENIKAGPILEDKKLVIILSITGDLNSNHLKS